MTAWRSNWSKAWCVFAAMLLAGHSLHACTTAVISGRITADGRPILWKNRDYASAPRNEVVLLTDGRYRVVAVVNAGSRKSVWMGSNEAGLCIENSLSEDLRTGDKKQGMGNGSFMKRVLQTCATVDDVRRLLEDTDTAGRATMANFGVIDAAGGAAVFEAGPNSHVMFDVNDPDVAPRGYLVRSNFSSTGKQLSPCPDPAVVTRIPSGDRYARACRLLESGRISTARESHRIALDYVIHQMSRDLADADGQSVPGAMNSAAGRLPELIETQNTISRHTTVSAVVFHGVKPGEDPRLTTMWAILGTPVFSIAVPCWATMQQVADPLEGPHGGEIGEIARLLRDAGVVSGQQAIRSAGLPGIWKDVWPIEQRMIAQTVAQLESWRRGDWNQDDLTDWHQRWAEVAYRAMHQEMLEAKAEALTVDQIQHPAPVRTGPVRVAIYDHSDGSARGPRNLLRILTVEEGFQAARISPEDIRAGHLQDYDVLIMPGGSGSAQAKRLENEGQELVRQFVSNGGGYVGICAGSYLASSHYSWSLNLINARVWDRAHWARGTGKVQLVLPEAGQVALNHRHEFADVYYGQGPLLVPGDTEDLPAYEALATYRSEIVGNGALPDAMRDTHAIIRSVYGQGRVICFSPHPETLDGPNHLIESGVRWAARPDQQKTNAVPRQ